MSHIPFHNTVTYNQICAALLAFHPPKDWSKTHRGGSVSQFCCEQLLRHTKCEERGGVVQVLCAELVINLSILASEKKSNGRVCVWDIIKSDRNISVSASLDWFFVYLVKWRIVKKRRDVKVEEWRREKGMGPLPNPLKMICTIKPCMPLNGSGIHESSRLGPGKNWRTVHAKCPRTRQNTVHETRCPSLLLPTKVTKVGEQRKPQINPFSLLLFHLPHPQFNLTTGRNLPPADTQISTDAKVLPLMAGPTPSCTRR